MMESTPNTFRHWHNPSPNEVGDDILAFIKILSGPTWITLEGRDTSRQRAIVTLLHGNEPSGLKAIHEFLKNGEQAETNLGIFVVSVNAASLAPFFSHRYLPNEADFNRCFHQIDNAASDEQSLSNQEVLARKIVETLRDYSPEAIIDTHNTSAHSEAFAVACSSTEPLLQITQIFTKKLVVLDQELGTLIEQDMGCPTITVEFGGFLDLRADTLALNTLNYFINTPSLFSGKGGGEEEQVQLLKQPLRLEVKPGAKLHYSASVQGEADITIFNTIDQMNFSHIEANTSIGWSDEESINNLIVESKFGKNSCEELFYSKDGFLLSKVAMTIFMATTDAYIASNDCLMYLCPSHESIE